MVNKYLILDSRGNAVAHGVSKYAPNSPEWCMEVDDGDLEEISKHTFLCLVGNSDAVPAMEAKIVKRNGRNLTLEPIRPLGQSVRKNLRIPARFESYIYPISGRWKGRAPVVSKDLSCGGVAFFCPQKLEVGEVVQIVIPVTAQPLLLNVEILRHDTGSEDSTLYATRFLSLLREEESMVREAVFSLQLKKS